MNGKGKAPEKGRNLPKFRDGYDGINWRKKDTHQRMLDALGLTQAQFDAKQHAATYKRWVQFENPGKAKM